MSSMNKNVKNREEIIQVLVRELVGPSPDGKPLNSLSFENKEDAYGPFFDKETGEEIIQQDTPSKRYGIAVLHQFATSDEDDSGQEGTKSKGNLDENLQQGISDTHKENLIKNTDAILDRLYDADDQSPGDLDLTPVNSFKPSSIGVSLLAEFPPGAWLVVDATGGRYEALEVQVAGKPRTWWVRRAVSMRAEFSGENLTNSKSGRVLPDKDKLKIQNQADMALQIELYIHPFDRGITNQRLLTVCLVNRTGESGEENKLFQSRFRLSVVSDHGKKHILPYPGPEFSSLDEEEKSMSLLYRHEHMFGVGHGCAAMWDYKDRGNKAEWISAECLPAIETPSITPDILDENGDELRISMAALAGIVDGVDGHDSLEKLIRSYENWISQKEKELETLETGELRAAGQRHIMDCRYCATRMRNGLNYLKSDKTARRAFQLANRAVLFQQIHSRPEVRRWTFDEKNKRSAFLEPYEKPDPLKGNSSKGYWRAFQMAFLLATLVSAADAESTEREIIELIWFPTGGGKTEAYLGLSAFGLLLRRMKNKNDDGVHVLMRYTLRLLTTQQFLRASRLICALELIRRENPEELGTKEFSIGLWVGGNNTPNTKSDALAILKALEKGDKYVENKFVLDRCPWCSAQLGPLEGDQSKKSKIYVLGYYRVGNSVYFRCSDNNCEFKSRLPIYVTDEEMYENPPSMVIGTVDKFAMLTWKPYARALFGIDSRGIRIRTPPGLIIQDELHLISGPLGSMVGLFEGLIEELCTDRRFPKLIKPKIVSSTATIRRYREQIKALYARNQACLFPPPGLDVGDSFFSKYATKHDGAMEPGRIFVGIHAPGLGSMQTLQVRTATALLQSPLQLQDGERDPWWTLIMFFNSLRELGGALTLFQSDILDYQQVYLNRQKQTERVWRAFPEIIELTGRASSEDIPKAIKALEKRYDNLSNQKPVDVCLASNILEVGIDIERLSLMTVVGQPKTTSQYIQVTGRVGRNWKERPGLVVTLYSSSKPRDRSHYEKFLSYHQKLYAQVEPTSVTPFAAPVLERALHAVIIAYVRQTGDEDIAPYPYPEALINQLQEILRPRIELVDAEQTETFGKIISRIAKQWKRFSPIHWEPQPGNSEDLPLMKVAGTFVEQKAGDLPLPTMQSMRSVDAECIAELRYPAFIEGDSQDDQKS